VFRYKSKVRYRRKTGHRQSLTRLKITDILLDGESSLPAQPAQVEAPVAVIEGVEPVESVEETATPARRRRASAAVEEPSTVDESTPEGAQPESGTAEAEQEA
jgi:Ribosomal prokaryotic L21 protein